MLLLTKKKERKTPVETALFMKEFWVSGITDTDRFRLFLQVRYGAAVPCFLKEVLVPIVRAGQQLQVLIKIFEWCSYVIPGHNTYDEIFPCWKDFLNSPSPSPLIFNKKSTEALVVARTNYYSMMQGKLEKVSTKFKFRHQQVNLCC